MNNKKLGNSFEDEFCDILRKNGFWVHRLNPNSAGQPADVVAVKNGRGHLIDCKVCSNNKFALSRIEDNQVLAMKRWGECGNGYAHFALKMSNGDIYMLLSETMFEEMSIRSSIPEDDIHFWGITLERWMEIHNE